MVVVYEREFMSESTELLPCPFCGGNPVMHTIDEHGPNFGAQFIECSGCQCSTYLMFPLMDSVDRQLAEKWNRRTHLASQPEAAQEPVGYVRHYALKQLGGKAHTVINSEPQDKDDIPLYTRPVAQEGWRLVPVDPTMGMYDDFCAVFPYPFGHFQEAYKAMLAAAPQPKGGERE